MGKGIINRVFLVFGLILLTFFISNARAATCDYKFKAEAMKVAKNVTASYEIKSDDSGLYVVITVYNIVDDIYVSYTESGGSGYVSPKNIFKEGANEVGTYSIVDRDINNIKKYTFKVYSTNSSCSGVLRSFTLTKPKYNKFSELPECSYYDVEDFLYCQKWITTNFNMSEAAVVERINEQRNKYKNSVTTVCISCEQDKEYYEWLVRFNKMKRYIIIGLSIGIVVDIVIIILLFRKIKEDSIV